MWQDHNINSDWPSTLSGDNPDFEDPVLPDSVNDF